MAERTPEEVEELRRAAETARLRAGELRAVAQALRARAVEERDGSGARREADARDGAA